MRGEEGLAGGFFPGFVGPEGVGGPGLAFMPLPSTQDGPIAWLKPPWSPG